MGGRPPRTPIRAHLVLALLLAAALAGCATPPAPQPTAQPYTEATWAGEWALDGCSVRALAFKVPPANAQGQVGPGWHTAGTVGSVHLRLFTCDRVQADGGVAARNVAFALLYVAVDSPDNQTDVGYIVDLASNDTAVAAALTANGFPAHPGTILLGSGTTEVTTPAYTYHGQEPPSPTPVSEHVKSTFDYYHGPASGPARMREDQALDHPLLQQPEMGAGTGLLATLAGSGTLAGTADVGEASFGEWFQPPA